MGAYSIGEALEIFLQRNSWKPKMNEVRLHKEWEQIAGKTISKYTRNVYLNQQTLILYTDVAPLKQELLLGKQQLMERINQYFGETVVTEVVIK